MKHWLIGLLGGIQFDVHTFHKDKAQAEIRKANAEKEIFKTKYANIVQELNDVKDFRKMYVYHKKAHNKFKARVYRAKKYLGQDKINISRINEILRGKDK